MDERAPQFPLLNPAEAVLLSQRYIGAGALLLLNMFRDNMVASSEFQQNLIQTVASGKFNPRESVKYAFGFQRGHAAPPVTEEEYS